MSSTKTDLSNALAVVGMAGRFPGAASVEQLWKNLLRKVEGISFLSKEELKKNELDPALVDDPDYVPAKGIIEGIEYFDASFFEYSAREAVLMDPQQRLFLECAWHALERAGCDPARYDGAAGVFASSGMSTYLVNLYADSDVRKQVGLFDLMLGNAPDYLTTRVSYKAGLLGPSINLQTACSSSLVAIHMACQSLLGGECDLALAGGVTARVPQRLGYLYEVGSAFSPDGHCRPFDARAAGTVPAEAVAVVALKRAEDAIRDRNHIHALVLGSAINNDGNRKVGYTAPGVDGQCRVISEALEIADVDPRTVTFVEAHGTGTPMGDPLEVAALTKAFGSTTAERQHCALGAIKSNIGHVDAAAGVAGFIKAVLALEHGKIPPTLHFEKPNPVIDFAASPFFVNNEILPWKPEGMPRRAGVSAFGIGGTNAHAILQEPPAVVPGRSVQVPGDARLFLLSARSEPALERITDALSIHLEENQDVVLADAAFTSQVGRKAFEHRRILTARDRDDAIAALRARNPMQVATARSPSSERPIAFVFPGGGTQYPNMGRQLYESEEAFRESIDYCVEIARKQIDIDLRQILYPTPERYAEAEQLLREPRFLVLSIWVTEYALARTLMNWGISPQCMVGHSLGEYVAACLSGVLSVEDAVAMVALRGLLYHRVPEGASLSVSMPERELVEVIPPGVEISVINTPSQCVVSGRPEVIDAFEQTLVGKDVQVRRLNVAAAVHSSHVEPVMGEVRRFAENLEIGSIGIPYLSNVTGAWIRQQDITADYWAQHLRRTVRFSDNIQNMLQQGGFVVLEVGPGVTLTTLVGQQITPDNDTVVIPTMRHPRDKRADREVLLQSLGRAWSHGVDIDWAALHGESEHRLTSFPVYSFERQKHWIDARPSSASGAGTNLFGNDDRAVAESRSASSGTAPPALRLAEPYHDDPLARAVAEIWQAMLGISDFQPEHDFFALGGTSLVAVQLMSRLQRRLGLQRKLQPQELLQAPAFGAFVDHLRSTGAFAVEHGEARAGNEAAQRSRPQVQVSEATSLVLLQTGTAAHLPPVLFVHPGGGHVFHYRLLAKALGPAWSVYGFKAPGLDGEQAPLDTVEALAEHHLASLRKSGWARAPYCLAGSSMGGYVAFEMAQRLLGMGEEVAFLSMLDTPGPGQIVKGLEDHTDYVGYLFGGMWGVEISPERLRQLPEDARIPYALEQMAKAGVDLGYDEDDARHVLDVFVSNARAMRAYEPKPYSGAITFFRARERRKWDPDYPDGAWTPYVQGKMLIEVVPGDHITMHEPPHVEELAARMRRCLMDSLGVDIS